MNKITPIQVSELISIYGTPLRESINLSLSKLAKIKSEEVRDVALAYGMEIQLERLAATLKLNFRLAKLSKPEASHRIKLDAVEELLESFGASDPSASLGSLHLTLPLFFDYKLAHKSSDYLDDDTRNEVELYLTKYFSISHERLVGLQTQFLTENPLHQIQPISKLVQEIEKSLGPGDFIADQNSVQQAPEPKGSDLRGFEKMRFHLRSFIAEMTEGLGLVLLIVILIGVGATLKYIIRH